MQPELKFARMAKKFDLKLKGYVGGWDFDTDYVDYVLDKAGDREVSVLIDSLGGAVDTALSVSSAFAQHGNVHVYYRGMNASAATIASMGAKHIAIEKSAMYLVHKCSQIVFEWAALNADQLKEKAEAYKGTASDLEKIDLTVAQMYAGRCKKSAAELLDLMKENKWLTAQEALEWGFVDEVVDSTEDVHLTQSVATAMAAAGIPLPENMSVEADGFLAQMEAMFKKWFGKKNEAPVATAAAEPPVSTNKNQSVMKKTFVFVAAVLAAIQSAMPEANAEGKYPMDEPALDALEKALADADKAGKEKDSEIKDLKDQLAAKVDELTTANARIADLEKRPAAKEKEVVETGDHAPENSEKTELEQLSATFAHARAMLNGAE